MTIASKLHAETSSRVALWIAVTGGALALILRLYYVLHAQVLQPVNQPHVTGDAVDYYRYAWNMVHHGVFSSSSPESLQVIANSFRDPGYPTLLALWMLVFPDFDRWYGVVLLTQALLGALTVVLMVMATRRWLPAWALAAAAVGMAIWPHCLAMPSFLLSENLLAPLSAGAALLSAEAASRRIAASWGGAGFAWSLAGMTNAVMLPVATVIGVVLLLRRLESRQCIMALILASLVLPAAWGVRSMTIPSPRTSGSRVVMNFVQGSWPSYHDDYQLSAQGSVEAILALAVEGNEMQELTDHPREGMRAILQRMGGDPGKYLRWYLSKPALLWSWDIRIGQGDIYVYPTKMSPLKAGGSLEWIEILCFILNPLIGVLALIGAACACLSRRPRPDLLVVALVPLFVTAVYTTLQSEPRYSVAFRGFEIVLAAYAMTVAHRWVRERRVR